MIVNPQNFTEIRAILGPEHFGQQQTNSIGNNIDCDRSIAGQHGDHGLSVGIPIVTCDLTEKHRRSDVGNRKVSVFTGN